MTQAYNQMYRRVVLECMRGWRGVWWGGVWYEGGLRATVAATRLPAIVVAVAIAAVADAIAADALRRLYIIDTYPTNKSWHVACAKKKK